MGALDEVLCRYVPPRSSNLDPVLKGNCLEKDTALPNPRNLLSTEKSLHQTGARDRFFRTSDARVKVL